MSETLDLREALGALLKEPPTTVTWAYACAVARSLPDDATLREGFSSHWPDEARVFPHNWAIELLEGQVAPWQRLGRHLDLDHFGVVCEEQVQRLCRREDLSITTLSLRETFLDERSFRSLLSAPGLRNLRSLHVRELEVDDENDVVGWILESNVAPGLIDLELDALGDVGVSSLLRASCLRNLETVRLRAILLGLAAVAALDDSPWLPTAELGIGPAVLEPTCLPLFLEIAPDRLSRIRRLDDWWLHPPGLRPDPGAHRQLKALLTKIPIAAR